MLTRLCKCVASFLLNKQKTQKKSICYHSRNSNRTSVLPWHPEKTVAWKSRVSENEQWDRPLTRPCCQSFDRLFTIIYRVAIFPFFCCFLFNDGTPAYVCDRIGKETGKCTKSRRKTETAAVRTRVFGKSYRLVQVVESNDMYDRLVRLQPFHIVLILRVPADNIVLLLN